MDNEEKSIPLSGLKKPEDKPTAPAPETPPQKPGQPSNKSKYVLKEDPAKAKKRLAMTVVVETILLILLAVLDIYLAFFYVPSLRKQNSDNLKQANQNIAALQEDRDRTVLENNALTAKRAQLEKSNASKDEQINTLQGEKQDLLNKKGELETSLSKLTAEKTKVDGDLAALNDQYNKLNTDYKDVVNKKTELTDAMNALEKNLADIQKSLADTKKELSDVKTKIDERTKALAEVKDEIDKEYGAYSPAALAVISGLDGIAASLRTGINFKQFSQMLKEFETTYEQFKLGSNNNISSFTSFQLIGFANNTYKDTWNRWQNLIAISPADTNWQTVMVKLENPIITNRPWMDQMQQLWPQAIAATQMAGYLVQNKELPADKCLLCNDKGTINCLKCNGSGICVNCEGTGKKDKVACIVCEASGKCPICFGRTTVPCPLCMITKKPIEKPAEPPKAEPAKDTQPTTEQPKTTEPAQPSAQPKETPPAEQPK